MHLPPIDLDPAKVNLALLPLGLQQLSRVIGLGAAMKLADRYPGLTIYVPEKATDQHYLAMLIGAPAMEKLCINFGPGKLLVPKLDRILQQLKRRLVLDLREQGYSARDIALALNYTERHVLRLANDLPETKNLDLFGGDE